MRHCQLCRNPSHVLSMSLIDNSMICIKCKSNQRSTTGERMNLTEAAITTNTMQNWRKEDDSFWKDTLFEKFKNMSSVRKGSQGEKLTADLMEQLGSHVPRDKKGRPKKPKGAGSEYDLFLDHRKVEVKTSTTWDNVKNSFKWQQLRSTQDYDRVIFVGINPNEIYLWWCTKEDLKNNIFGKNKHRQHAGKNGEQELYWLGTNGDTDLPEVPAWFREIGSWND